MSFAGASVVPRLRWSGESLRLRSVELKHLKILQDNIHICLEALHRVCGTSLAGLSRVLCFLDLRQDVRLSLYLFCESSEPFRVEADQLHLVCGRKGRSNRVFVQIHVCDE